MTDLRYGEAVEGAAVGGEDGLLRWFERIRERRPLSVTLPDGVVANDEFERNLERERVRAERTGLPCTLISFEFPELAEIPLRRIGVIHRCLANALVQRTRVTDVVGWSRGQLALILPHTTAEAAGRLCESIQVVFREQYLRAAAKQGDVPRMQPTMFTSDASEIRIQGMSSKPKVVEFGLLKAAPQE